MTSLGRQVGGCPQPGFCCCGRTEEDGEFTFIVSGFLPALSLISLWLISHLSSALQSIVNHYKQKLVALLSSSWEILALWVGISFVGY